MEINKGLLVTSFFLSYLDKEIYEQKNQDLGIVVSDSNFFIWAPDKEGCIFPADPAKKEDWIDAYKLSKIEKENNFNSIEIFKIMMSYLKFYEKEFNFELNEVINLLENMLLSPDKYKDLWMKWEKCFEGAEEYKVAPFEKFTKGSEIT